jgi:hypothetical protein
MLVLVRNLDQKLSAGGIGGEERVTELLWAEIPVYMLLALRNNANTRMQLLMAAAGQ